MNATSQRFYCRKVAFIIYGVKLLFLVSQKEFLKIVK